MKAKCFYFSFLVCALANVTEMHYGIMCALTQLTPGKFSINK